MKISKAVGIDLGTTNSVIAMVGRNNEIICRTDRSGRRTFPSVVAYDRRRDALQAGAPAFAKRGTAADPIVSVKSHMGDADYRATTGPKTLTPVEVSSIILGEMKRQMQEYLESNGYEDHIVDRAVITIPAHFASNAREATTKAAEDAGFVVEYTLQEPTAAVLFYAHQQGIEDGIFLVYDLGGGTFDVSVVKVDGGDVVVLGIAGNNYLGGDNFDEALARYLLEDLQNDTEMGYDLDGFDPHHDPEDRQRFVRLKLVAESIKKSLSQKDEHYEEFANIFTDKSGTPVHLALEVKREAFEGQIRPIVESTVDEVHRALDKAKKDYQITLDMVDAVLLVGGSTHIPLVTDVIVENFTDPSLAEHTKQPVPLRYEPDMAVGFGAALAAAATGVSTLSPAAVAVMTGAAPTLDALGSDEVVLAPTFGPGYGYEGESVVEGTLATLRGGLPNTVFARVTRAAGGFTKDYPVAADGSFAFTGLLSENDPEPYACEFVSGTTAVGQATFDAAIRNAPHASVVLSRTYYIETMGAEGETRMVELMRQGEALPITREYDFATNPVNNYFVELHFFEERDCFLKKVTITFPEPVPAGTPVKLWLSCNLQSKFSARAEVAGVVVDTEFEPSPSPAMPTEEEVYKVARDARSKIEQVPEAGKRIVTQKKLDRLVTELDGALEEGDSGKARDKLAAISDLVLPPSDDGLKPPESEFDVLVRRCEQANERSEQGDSDVAKEIRAAAAAGRAAYREENQARLDRAVNDLKIILKGLETVPPPLPGQEPPLWMKVLFFAEQLIGMINAAEARTDLSEAFRRDRMSSAAGDRSVLRAAMQACTPPVPLELAPSTWMNDEEAGPHMAEVVRVLRKWKLVFDAIGAVLPTALGD